MSPSDASLEFVVSLAVRMLPADSLWFIEEEHWKTAVSKARRLIAWAAEEPTAPAPTVMGDINRQIQALAEWAGPEGERVKLGEAHRRLNDLPFLSRKSFPNFVETIREMGAPVELSGAEDMEVLWEKLREADKLAEQQHREKENTARRNRRAKQNEREKELHSSPGAKTKKAFRQKAK